MVLYSSIVTAILIFITFKYFTLKYSYKLFVSAIMNEYKIDSDREIRETVKLLENKIEYHIQESAKGNRKLLIKLKGKKE